MSTVRIFQEATTGLESVIVDSGGAPSLLFVLDFLVCVGFYILLRQMLDRQKSREARRRRHEAKSHRGLSRGPDLRA